MSLSRIEYECTPARMPVVGKSSAHGKHAIPTTARGVDENVPKAYLNYILFDEDFVPYDFGFDQISDDALETFSCGNPGDGLPPGSPCPHERLALTAHAQVPGYAYIYLSNESNTITDVYFDDLRIDHRSVFVTQATDYGAWGDVIREQKADESIYRYGYQGQFAEKDDETGWSHFELREYDPVIGRWTAVDPKRQYFSPYRFLGNSSVNKVDPDGGCDKCPKIRHRQEYDADDVLGNMISIHLTGQIDAGFQAGVDIGLFGMEGDALSAILVSADITFWFDMKNNEIIWDAPGSSIFVDIARDKMLNINSELSLEFLGFSNQIQHKGDLVENLKGFDFMEFLEAPLSTLVGPQTDSHGNQIVKENSDGSIFVGMDFGAQFIIGVSASVGMNIPAGLIKEMTQPEMIAEKK